ncbi:MAG: phage tail protein [Pyrinomonadaceae bacterium]|nr:phage tail protein [Pyrinomonadaceae bacterium]MBP6211778.1 phage tail protein [Pyrinomonadaceae bacterium]
MKNITLLFAMFLLFASVSFGQTSTPAWPATEMRFEVEHTIDGRTFKFTSQEISGLDSEVDVFRNGNSSPTTVKMPGLKNHSDVTINNVVFSNDKDLMDWQKLSIARRSNMTIRLLDEDGNRMFEWTLKNAFPKKITGLKTARPMANNFVIAHEGIAMESK